MSVEQTSQQMHCSQINTIMEVDGTTPKGYVHTIFANKNKLHCAVYVISIIFWYLRLSRKRLDLNAKQPCPNTSYKD